MFIASISKRLRSFRLFFFFNTKIILIILYSHMEQYSSDYHQYSIL